VVERRREERARRDFVRGREDDSLQRQCGASEHSQRAFVAWASATIFKGRAHMTDMSRSDIDQVGSKAQDSVERIADRAKGAIDNASSVASQTVSKVEDASKQAWDIGQRLGTQAKDQAQEVAGQVSEQTSRTLSAVTRQVQAEPLLGILVAGAIGYFLALLSHRR
jgi:ElaB/YqjD/DUF883 family membrane-anchored ribosome-binding protein